MAPVPKKSGRGRGKVWKSPLKNAFNPFRGLVPSQWKLNLKNRKQFLPKPPNPLTSLVSTQTGLAQKVKTRIGKLTKLKQPAMFRSHAEDIAEKRREKQTELNKK